MKGIEILAKHLCFGKFCYTVVVKNSKQKGKLQRFLLIKEVIMMLLLGLSFLFLALEHLEKLSDSQLAMVDIYEIMLAFIFLAEFVFELRFAKDKARYWRTHWFYLLASIPVPTTMFEVLKGIRALRLLRLLKIFTTYRYERNTRLFEAPVKTK